MTAADRGDAPLNVLVGQMFVVQPDPALEPGPALEASLATYTGGFMLRRDNAPTIEAFREFAHLARSHWRTFPPAIVAVDEEGGFVSDTGHLTTPAPSAAALGAINDPDVTRDVYESLGRKLRALGANTVFAPVLDVNSEAANPVIGTRAFGADAATVVAHGVAAVEGLRAAGVAAAVKHFPGHGATTADSHHALPRVKADRALLKDRDLAPFAEVIERVTPELIMTAHVAYPALEDRPATLSRVVLRDLLRGEMGYKGVIVTDAMEMAGVAQGRTPGQAALEAIGAGADLLLYANDRAMAAEAYRAVVEALEKRAIPEDRIHESVDRILHLRSVFAGRAWIEDDDAYDALDYGAEDQSLFEAAMEALSLEGEEMLRTLGSREGAKLAVLPTESGGRPLDLEVVREQLVPAGYELLEVGAEPSAEDVGRVRERAAGAGVILVATASRGPTSESVKKLIEAATAPEALRIGAALLNPLDTEAMAHADCRIRTYGTAAPQLWALCQRLIP